ncbi:unnamed protein product [Blepharisma stoltei]|uniref:Uncharacterized protein n=1 Tax=Blepharisma stoltei TaxID=1481888 RepID=A0AAU9IR78_9CILI|nr:unnamed protein product [Blepharisma stoltei]
MSNEENIDMFQNFFQHISAVHEDAQTRVTALFSQIRQEALAIFNQNVLKAIDKKPINSQQADKSPAKTPETCQPKRKEEAKKLKRKQKQHKQEPPTIKIDDTDSPEEAIDENEPPVSQKIYECLTKTPQSKKYFAKKTGAKVSTENVPIKRKRDNSILEEFEVKYIAPIKRKVAELIKAGVSSKVIAKLYNISPICVEAIGNWKNCRAASSNSKIKMRDQIMKLHSEGQGVKEIAKTLNIWQNIVRDYLGEIPINSLSRNNHVKKILIDKIKAGVAESQLSNLTGISIKNLSAWRSKPQAEWVDEDTIQSDGETGREEIREALYCHLIGNDGNVSITNKKEKISRWLSLISDDNQHLK